MRKLSTPESWSGFAVAEPKLLLSSMGAASTIPSGAASPDKRVAAVTAECVPRLCPNGKGQGKEPHQQGAATQTNGREPTQYVARGEKDDGCHKGHFRQLAQGSPMRGTMNGIRTTPSRNPVPSTRAK